MIDKQAKRTRRHNKIRTKIKGTPNCPRLAVYRSNKAIYAQLIDDEKEVTLVAASDPKILAQKAIALGIKKVVFDRGGFLYVGRVKNFADKVRENGLKF